MSTALRVIFNRKLRGRLYTKLKIIKEFQDLDVSTLVNFSSNVINDNEDIISKYLEGYVVTIENLDQSADWVVEKILIPRILEMRVR